MSDFWTHYSAVVNFKYIGGLEHKGTFLTCDVCCNAADLCQGYFFFLNCASKWKTVKMGLKKPFTLGGLLESLIWKNQIIGILLTTVDLRRARVIVSLWDWVHFQSFWEDKTFKTAVHHLSKLWAPSWPLSIFGNMYWHPLNYCWFKKSQPESLFLCWTDAQNFYVLKFCLNLFEISNQVLKFENLI